MLDVTNSHTESSRKEPELEAWEGIWAGSQIKAEAYMSSGQIVNTIGHIEVVSYKLLLHNTELYIQNVVRNGV